MSFTPFHLHPQIPAGVEALGYSTPTPTQIRAIPSVLQGQDVMGLARTGTGKTAAFVLPILERLIKRPRGRIRVLVFTRTKHRARRVGQQLERAGFRAAALQGNLSQNQRQAALDGFRNGTVQVLVAIDIVSRGIDVSRISHVINYDMPATADAYTHRIGRTGRAEKSGDAFPFMTREDGAVVRSIERVLGKKVECRRVPGFDYKKPAPARVAEFARLSRGPHPRERRGRLA
jgi:ATP-dependent RNA helicase RhlE